MTEFEFTLHFRLVDPIADPNSYVEQLGAAGCDDALIGIGQPGRLSLQFNREAETAEEAIISAIADVKRTVLDAQLTEAAPDLVGLTDIAGLLGFSRQYMRKLVQENAATFPSPFHAGKTGLWHLAKVLNWFQAGGDREVDQALLAVAHITMQVNIARELPELDQRISVKLADCA